MTETAWPTTWTPVELPFSIAEGEPLVLGETPTPILRRGYVGHIGSCMAFDGTVFAIPVQNNVAIVMRRDFPAGLWREIHRFDAPEDGKDGAGTIELLPNGTLWCGLSYRSDNGQLFGEALLEGAWNGAEEAAPLWDGEYVTMADLNRPLTKPVLAKNGQPFEPHPYRISKQLASDNQTQRILKRMGLLK